MDDTFTHLKSLSEETIIYISETQSYCSGTSKSRYEWNNKLCTKVTTDSKSFDQSGNQIRTSKVVVTYTWQDELNRTEETESYLNGSLEYRESGYSKYTY